jgi:hypothetical protein
MKSLLAGIVLILVIGLGGFMYRNAIENRSQPPQSACTLEAKLCPDGSSVGREGPNCEFKACPTGRVRIADAHISYEVPEGLASSTPGPDAVAVYDLTSASARLIIRRFDIGASSTALDTIRATAIGGASGEPVPTTAYSSTVIGQHRFTVVAIERFEGVVDTAYYLARNRDILRFDAIDHEVLGWTDIELDVAKLPGAVKLRELLATLELE